MSCSMRRSPMSHSLEFRYKCYIYKKHQHLGKFQRICDIGYLVGFSSKSKAYRVFNHATNMVEETFVVEFDETNSSQGASDNLHDVGGGHEEYSGERHQAQRG